MPHFVNSCGSLWGIERDQLTGNTDFLGGAQRFTGQESIASLTKDDKDWFHVQTDDREQSIAAATNTPKRRAAWDCLSTTQAFSYLEAEALVCERQAIMSKSTFYHWWHNFLIRQKLVEPVAGGDPDHPRYSRVEDDIPIDERK